MTIESDQRGLQVCTGQYLPETFSGVCLEPQQLPDTHLEFSPTSDDADGDGADPSFAFAYE